MPDISDLNPATPTGQNLVRDGDNEIQQIKSALVTDFGGINAPVYQDADTSGNGGSTPVTAATMSSWEARIQALESVATSPDGTSIPVGGILLWDSSIMGAIPVGFKVCDGTRYQYTDGNGQSQFIQTPDLRGRFPVGSGITAGGAPLNPGTEGGVDFNENFLGLPAIKLATVAAGSHAHKVPGTVHALSISEMPQHGHAMYSNETSNVTLASLLQSVARRRTATEDYSMSSGTVSASVGATGASGGSQGHSHPEANSDTKGNHTHDYYPTPPYRGLEFICYVADGVPA